MTRHGTMRGFAVCALLASMPGCASSLKCTTGSTLSAVPTQNRLHTNGFRLTAPDDPSTSHSPASSVSKPNEDGGSSASGVDLVRSADLSLDEDLINTILDAAHAVDAVRSRSAFLPSFFVIPSLESRVPHRWRRFWIGMATAVRACPSDFAVGSVTRVSHCGRRRS